MREHVENTRHQASGSQHVWTPLLEVGMDNSRENDKRDMDRSRKDEGIKRDDQKHDMRVDKKREEGRQFGQKEEQTKRVDQGGGE